MLDFLYSIDLGLLYFFNHQLSNPAFDKFFSTITRVDNWFITYIVFGFILLFKGGAKGRLVFVFLILLITVTDQTGYRLLKETICRIRPCNIYTDLILPIGCAGGFSFPSNHALNNFAIATFLSFVYPNYRVTFIIVAFLVAFSRLYLGVHYPSDVLGGGMLGVGFGYVFALFYQKALNLLPKKQ